MALLLCILGLAAFPSFGIRMEHDSPSQSAWNSTSSEELQQMLMEELSPGGPGRTASALECTRDENDESLETPLGVREGWVSQDAESLEKLIGRVRNAWAEGDASGCFQQLGSMIANLTTTCEENKPQENYMDYIFQYYTPPLSKKTCKDSVDDIFVHGSALVEAMQISKEDVAALKLDATTVAMVQSLFFLRAWLIPLARTHSSALLWAGFWDADPSKRTTLETLREFASATDHSTVHPDSSLGQAIASSDNLVDCYKDETSQLLTNMWAMASMSFVLGMMEKGQGTVVALVNKGMRGERALQKAVLYEHEVPTLGVAAYGLGYWSPQVLLIDLQGTCSQTSPALQQQLSSRLGRWASSKQKKCWRLQDFVLRSRLHWRCLDCGDVETCDLDPALAKQVTQLVEEKQMRDQKGRELLHAVTSLNEVNKELDKERAEEDRMLGTLKESLQTAGRWMDAMQVLEHITTVHTKRSRITRNGHHSQVSITPQDLIETADLNVADTTGSTVLHWAAEEGNMEVAGLLLEHRADLNPRREDGCTPLHTAAVKGHSALAALLCEHGAAVNPYDDQGNMPLHVAAFRGYSEVASVLLNHRAEVNAHDALGDTPLYWAAMWGHAEVAQLLLKHGAKVTAGDQIMARGSVKELLQQHGAGL